MSTTHTSAQTTAQSGESTAEKADRLAAFLREEAAHGETYLKAKFIADDVDLSPKEIGALILQLQDSVQGIEIEQWSYTSATTWRVSPTEARPPPAHRLLYVGPPNGRHGTYGPQPLGLDGIHHGHDPRYRQTARARARRLRL